MGKLMKVLYVSILASQLLLLACSARHVAKTFEQHNNSRDSTSTKRLAEHGLNSSASQAARMVSKKDTASTWSITDQLQQTITNGSTTAYFKPGRPATINPDGSITGEVDSTRSTVTTHQDKQSSRRRLKQHGSKTDSSTLKVATRRIENSRQNNDSTSTHKTSTGKSGGKTIQRTGLSPSLQLAAIVLIAGGCVVGAWYIYKGRT